MISVSRVAAQQFRLQEAEALRDIAPGLIRGAALLSWPLCKTVSVGEECLNAHTAISAGSTAKLKRWTLQSFAGGLRLAPASAELWAALGCAAVNPAAREYALGRSLQLEPRSAFAWTALGRLYAETGGIEGRDLAADCFLQVNACSHRENRSMQVFGGR